MQTIFDKSKDGKRCASIRPLRVGEWKYKHGRTSLNLPSVCEADLIEHYMGMIKEGEHYPVSLGQMAMNLDGFINVHPLQDEQTIEGCLELVYNVQEAIKHICGADAVSLVPMPGKEGQFAALWIADEFFKASGGGELCGKVIVFEGDKGVLCDETALCGFEVLKARSNATGGVDLEHFKEILGKDIAAVFISYPNMDGRIESEIKEVIRLARAVGALVVCDGTRLDELTGIVRPMDLGCDIVCLEGGAVGVKKDLARFLPKGIVERDKKGRYFVQAKGSIGRVSMYFGEFMKMVDYWSHILRHGGDGLKEAAQIKTLIKRSQKTQKPQKMQIENIKKEDENTDERESVGAIEVQ